MPDRTETYAAAQAVARELGSGWRATEGNPYAYLDHADGRRVILDGRSDASKGRWVLSGSYPEGGSQYAGSHSIGVSVKRNPAQVGVEICRRLLPAYNRDFERVTAQLADDDAAATAREAVAEKVLAVPGAQRLNMGRGSDQVRVSLPGYGRSALIRRDGSLITLELAEVPADLALRILRDVTAAEGTNP